MLAEIVLSLLALVAAALFVLVVAMGAGAMGDMVLVGLAVLFAVAFAGAAVVGQLRALRGELRRGAQTEEPR